MDDLPSERVTGCFDSVAIGNYAPYSFHLIELYHSRLNWVCFSDLITLYISFIKVVFNMKFWVKICECQNQNEDVNKMREKNE